MGLGLWVRPPARTVPLTTVYWHVTTWSRLYS